MQVAFGKFKPEDVSFDLRDKLFDLGVRFKQGEAIGIDKENRLIKVGEEDYTVDVSYDYLVIALGRHLTTEKKPAFLSSRIISLRWTRL